MRSLLLTVALTLCLTPLLGCSGTGISLGTGTGGINIQVNGGPGSNQPASGYHEPDAKQKAELDAAKGVEQDFLDYVVKAKWADARELLAAGYRERLLGKLKDAMWIEEALAKQAYFPDSKPGDGFAHDKEVPTDKKFDKAVIAVQTLLSGGKEALFEGSLTGPSRKASFLSRAVQEGGKWKVDSFVVIEGTRDIPTAARVAGEPESAQAIAGEFLDLIAATNWVQVRGVCGKEYVKRLLGSVLTDPTWVEEKLAKEVYFPDLKPGDGFAVGKTVPEEKQLTSYVVKSSRVNGDDATVEGEVKGPKRKADFKIKAIKEDGKWRINGLTLTDK